MRRAPVSGLRVCVVMLLHAPLATWTSGSGQVCVCRNAVCVVRLSVRCVFARVCRNAVARLSGYMDLVKAGRYVFVS